MRIGFPRLSSVVLSIVIAVPAPRRLDLEAVVMPAQRPSSSFRPPMQNSEVVVLVFKAICFGRVQIGRNVGLLDWLGHEGSPEMQRGARRLP
jgi:hypothetical protein